MEIIQIPVLSDMMSQIAVHLIRQILLRLQLLPEVTVVAGRIFGGCEPGMVAVGVLGLLLVVQRQLLIIRPRLRLLLSIKEVFAGLVAQIGFMGML